MMKTIVKRMFIYFSVVSLTFGMFITNISNVFAGNAGSSDVHIAYDITNKLFNLHMTVKPGGMVRDGGQSIKNGTLIYDLYAGNTKKFVIVPNQGYSIKRVLYEKPTINESIDVTSSLTQNELEIVMVGSEVRITVDFVKDIEIIVPEENVNPEKPDINVKTGQGVVKTEDKDNLVFYMTVMIISLLITGVIRKKRNTYNA